MWCIFVAPPVGNGGREERTPVFYGSQVELMAVSSVYLFGTVGKRTRSGTLASRTHLLLSDPIKESHKQLRGKRNEPGEERVTFPKLKLHLFNSTSPNKTLRSQKHVVYYYGLLGHKSRYRVNQRLLSLLHFRQWCFAACQVCALTEMDYKYLLTILPLQYLFGA